MNKTRLYLRQKTTALPKPLLIIGISLFIIALLMWLKPEPQLRPQAENIPLVESLHVTPAAHQPVISLYGRVESPQESQLSATISALVAAVPAKEGQVVEAGAVLIQLDPRDRKLALQQREAVVHEIEAQIASEKQRHETNREALKLEKNLTELAIKSADRYQRLSANSLGSDLSRDEALQQAQSQQLSQVSRQLEVNDHRNRLARLQAQLQQAEALRDQASLDLERTQILAPFKGRITALNVSPGNLVRPGESLVSLFNLDQIEVRAQIPSRHISAIQQALQAQQTLTGKLRVGSDSLTVKLHRLAGAIGTNRGGIDGLFTFTQPESQLILGQTGTLRLLLPAVANTLLVPPAALYGQERIYLIKDGTLETLPVERIGKSISPSGELWPLLKADLAPNSSVLTTQLSNAVGGLQVRANP